MDNQQKMILIQTIITYLKKEISENNKQAVRMKRYSEQIPFDEDDLFLTLLFMKDGHIKEIATKILG